MDIFTFYSHLVLFVQCTLTTMVSCFFYLLGPVATDRYFTFKFAPLFISLFLCLTLFCNLCFAFSKKNFCKVQVLFTLKEELRFAMFCKHFQQHSYKDNCALTVENFVILYKTDPTWNWNLRDGYIFVFCFDPPVAV